MKVAQDFELRKTIRQAGGGYQVMKNNIAAKASEGLPSESLSESEGDDFLAYTTADPVALAKALTAYAKANPAFTFKAGLVEGRVVDVKAFRNWRACLRGRLDAKLLWLINAPAQRLVTAINGVGRNLAVVIDQGVKENNFQAYRASGG